jgi:hypothetical protein
MGREMAPCAACAMDVEMADVTVTAAGAIVETGTGIDVAATDEGS